MPTVHVVQDSTATSERVEAARDFTDRRAELWRDVYLEHMTIHDRGEAGSTWEIRATPADEGVSPVDVIGVRHLRGRGWLLWPFFPLGLAKRDVADYLRTFLRKVEAG